MKSFVLPVTVNRIDLLSQEFDLIFGNGLVVLQYTVMGYYRETVKR